MLNSFLIVLSFISIFPVPQKFLSEWNSSNLRFFCVCLPLSGIIFGLSWPIIFYFLSLLTKISDLFKGFIFTFLTLALTGGLHMDGLMDTFDAIFSHQDKDKKLKILSDTHSGSFAVMSCVIALMFKTFLFSEVLSVKNLFLIPVFSRLGMGILLNNLKFAKSNGLAVILGSSRNSKHNIFFIIFFVFLTIISLNFIPIFFIISLLIWKNICIKIFVEISEIFMLIGAVIENCI